MKLIGKLDSPYVRRVAISLTLMDIPFEHLSLSVFRDKAAFADINPMLKAPTVVTQDGTVLMDSTLILDHLGHGLPSEKRLMPEDQSERTGALYILGLALAAADKSVQLVYETKLRPIESQYAPWVERVTAQARIAFAELEKSYAVLEGKWLLGTLSQADITTAIAWTFAQNEISDVIRAPEYPALVRLAAQAEELPAFRKWQPE
ncbi:glutathione S-transferase [Gluconobacter thailandicus F149-1 = NBRC 100600]|uniref:Glutathione S-transferase domain-containing protein n=1 Tax=Gluconobacter thailandicus NBRC 3257 TaxID=1381097 RepID=A0ABQ0IYF3_GLUTH|nr:glutathione S-transferase N-terminal domain-containing protein [Gluconobacter thailandicus]AFV99783.1 glutathione S-transferase domain-containing protein [Gluconobacter oxydans H24]ANQ41380.1 glutathione S-transferase [Gluconobacter oxydans]KXV53611.1 glutathione S-transferase [Gluconobacter thailandicus]GAC88508.1 glutathione S-transferase domain-containing protein [Gluconobacter thailandicus NBRC 3255]GAD27203.1 glutathione S-transferase domain-containing protein [Gluconobacter thailandic